MNNLVSWTVQLSYLSSSSAFKALMAKQCLLKRMEQVLITVMYISTKNVNCAEDLILSQMQVTDSGGGRGGGMKLDSQAIAVLLGRV